MSTRPLQTEAGNSIAAVLMRGCRRLAAIDSARLDCELLLAHVLQVSRTYLYTHAEQWLDATQLARFDELLARRLNHEPVAYLVGIREFWSLPLTVTRDTLVPRPETEQLVERALLLPSMAADVRIADLGTGSGAIAIALATELRQARIIATDNSAAALQVARANANRHCPGQIEFRLGNWWEPIADDTCDIIISNPPYVKANDPLLQATELQHEPHTALAAGPDGLADLRILCRGAGQHLNTNGWLLLEHGAEQAPALQQLLGNAGFQAINTHPDVAGLPRITMAQWPG